MTGPPTGGACVTTGDCSVGYRCNNNATCVELSASADDDVCATDADCNVGYRCSDDYVCVALSER